MAPYSLNKHAVTHARELIDAHQYVLDSVWGKVQPSADDETRSSSRTRGMTTASGASDLPTAPPTTPRPATGSSTATSAVFIGWASSRVSTAPRNGDTRRSSSPRTSSCSIWTTREPERLEGDVVGRAVVHFEVVGQDPEELRGFYRELFDWSSTRAHRSWTRSRSRRTTGSSRPRRATGSGSPGGVGGGAGLDGHVIFYVGVPDVRGGATGGRDPRRDATARPCHGSERARRSALRRSRRPCHRPRRTDLASVAVRPPAAASA